MTLSYWKPRNKRLRIIRMGLPRTKAMSLTIINPKDIESYTHRPNFTSPWNLHKEPGFQITSLRTMHILHGQCYVTLAVKVKARTSRRALRSFDLVGKRTRTKDEHASNARLRDFISSYLKETAPLGIRLGLPIPGTALVASKLVDPSSFASTFLHCYTLLPKAVTSTATSRLMLHMEQATL